MDGTVNLSSNDAILDPRVYPGLKSPFSQRLFKGSTKQFEGLLQKAEEQMIA